MTPTTWIVIMFVLNFILFIYFITSLVKNKDDRDDNPIIVNFSGYKEHGRSLGVVKDIVYGAGNRVQVTYSPKDIDLKKLMKDKKDIPDIPIIVDGHKLISIPKGGLSKDKNIYFALPKGSEDISEALKHTPLGVAMQFLTLEQDFINKKIEIMKDKISNRDALLKEIGDAEMSAEYVGKIKEFHKDMTNMLLETKDSKKSGSDSPSLKLPTSSGGAS